MTDVAPPEEAALPPGPAPIALAIAIDLVTRYRLRLADQRDSRLTGLGATHELAAAAWTGPRAALVAFFEPPADPAEAGRDLAMRCGAARRWGQERLRVQGAQVCDILLIALRPVSGALMAETLPGDPVRVGAAWVDAEHGNADTLLAIPPGLPSLGELRAKARAVRDGAPVPTLAAVDLAERQTVAGGYVAPVQRAMITQPVVTYSLIGVFVLIYLLERLLIPATPLVSSVGLYVFGGLANSGPIDWWRFVSSAFLHDNLSILHVVFNCLAMFWIGRLVEQLYGRLVLIGTFLLTAVTGGLLWIAASAVGVAGPSISIGASGGISGLIGLLLMLGRIQGKNVPVGVAHSVRNYAVTVIVLNIVFGFLFVGVNNYAHVGGLLGGIAAGAVLPPVQRIGGRDLSNLEKGVLAVVVAISAVALVIAAINLIGNLPIGIPQQ